MQRCAGAPTLCPATARPAAVASHLAPGVVLRHQPDLRAQVHDGAERRGGNTSCVPPHKPQPRHRRPSPAPQCSAAAPGLQTDAGPPRHRTTPVCAGCRPCPCRSPATPEGVQGGRTQVKKLVEIQGQGLATLRGRLGLEADDAGKRRCPCMRRGPATPEGGCREGESSTRELTRQQFEVLPGSRQRRFAQAAIHGAGRRPHPRKGAGRHTRITDRADR